MKNAAFYGLGIALVGALFTLVLYLLGYQTENLDTGKTLGWLGMAIPIVGIVMGMRDGKQAALKEEGAFGYGAAFKQGMAIVLFWCLGGAVFAYVYYAFINTEMVDYVIEAQRVELAAQDVPESQWEGIESFTRTMFKPGFQALIALVLGGLMGLVITLIAAIFVKTKADDSPAPAVSE